MFYNSSILQTMSAEL